jgi:hypothetical protein
MDRSIGTRSRCSRGSTLFGIPQPGAHLHSVCAQERRSPEPQIRLAPSLTRLAGIAGYSFLSSRHSLCNFLSYKIYQNRMAMSRKIFSKLIQNRFRLKGVFQLLFHKRMQQSLHLFFGLRFDPHLPQSIRKDSLQ